MVARREDHRAEYQTKGSHAVRHYVDGLGHAEMTPSPTKALQIILQSGGWSPTEKHCTPTAWKMSFTTPTSMRLDAQVEKPPNLTRTKAMCSR